MTNQQLINTLTNNLEASHHLSSSKLRCVNGQNLFIKFPDTGWHLAAIWDNEVAIVCNHLQTTTLGRGKNSLRLGSFFDTLSEKHIMIHIINGAGEPLRSGVRRISVKDIARKLLLQQTLQGTYRSNYDAMDAWNIVWSEAITQYAADFVEQQNRIGSKLSSSVFSNNLDHSGKLEQIREAVSKSDYSNETDKNLSELTTSLYNAYTKLSSVASEIRARKDSQRFIGVKACCTPYRYISEGMALSPYKQISIASPKGTNMFEQSATICQMFDRLGLPLPEVFGYKFCQENIPQLAVLNETMKEEVADRLKKMSGYEATPTTANHNTITNLLA